MPLLILHTCADDLMEMKMHFPTLIDYYYKICKIYIYGEKLFFMNITFLRLKQRISKSNLL